ncbi:MAG: hypothetical protein ACLFWL_14515 [Candidatus Brocadiia bacterium]
MFIDFGMNCDHEPAGVELVCEEDKFLLIRTNHYGRDRIGM